MLPLKSCLRQSHAMSLETLVDISLICHILMIATLSNLSK